VHGAGGVAHGYLEMAAVLLRGVQSGFQVPRVIQRVKHADNIDSVFDGLLDEFLDHVVGVMLITQKILPAQEHLQLGVGHGLAQFAQTDPRIFVQVAHAAVKSSAAPAFQRPKAGVVELLGRR